MVITQTVDIDLYRLKVVPVLQATQSDRYSRDIKFNLTDNGSAADVSGITSAIVRYRKPDGTGGGYDTMPDGTKAYSVGTSDVTVKLAPQVLTVPGTVELSVALVQGESELHTFPLKIDVQRNPGISATSEDYFSVKYFVAASGWNPNKYLGTDANGNVVEKDAPAGTGGTGMTEEQAAQLETNTQNIQTNAQDIDALEEAVQANRDDIDAIPVTVDEAGYTDIAGQRQPTSVKFARTDASVAVDITLQGDVPVSGVLTLDENGFPVSYTENGLEVSMGFEGFDDLLTTVWEGGSY